MPSATPGGGGVQRTPAQMISLRSVTAPRAPRSVMRVLVIGGSGFLGSRTVQALAKLPGVHVTASHRRHGSSVGLSRKSQSVAPRVDLDDPSTFSEMAKHDFVVNTSDTLAASPILAIDHPEFALDAWFPHVTD